MFIKMFWHECCLHKHIIKLWPRELNQTIMAGVIEVSSRNCTLKWEAYQCFTIYLLHSHYEKRYRVINSAHSKEALHCIPASAPTPEAKSSGCAVESLSVINCATHICVCRSVRAQSWVGYNSHTLYRTFRAFSGNSFFFFFAKKSRS
jgi:hypothetical protein